MNRTYLLATLGLTGALAVSSGYAQVTLPTPSSIQERPHEAHIRIQPEDPGSSQREQILKTELKMPGMGLQASAKQFENRLKYAGANNWFEQADREEFESELRNIVDCEAKIGSATDSQRAWERHKLSSKLYQLNQKFEELVLGPALTVSGSVVMPKAKKETE